MLAIVVVWLTIGVVWLAAVVVWLAIGSNSSIAFGFTGSATNECDLQIPKKK